MIKLADLLEFEMQPGERSKMKNFLYRGTRDQIDLMQPYDDSSTRYSKMKGTIEMKDPAPVEHPENKERVVGWKWDEPYTLEEYSEMQAIADSLIGREYQTLEDVRKIAKRLKDRGFSIPQIKAFIVSYLQAK